jgi:hypothetical protein
MAETDVAENWEKDLFIPAPGRLVYMGQGQVHYVYFHQGTPDPLWPKMKKKATAPQPAPAPSSPELPPAENWDAKIATSQ